MWYLYLALDDELAARFADLANNCVANLLAPAARDLMTAKLGALVHKPGQQSDELGARPIGIGNCDVRSFIAPHARDVTKAFLEVVKEKGNGRLQLGVGVPNGCPKAATDINLVLAIEGSVCQKGDMVATFQSADRAATYEYLLASPPELRRYASM